jgi:hypothetical protein
MWKSEFDPKERTQNEPVSQQGANDLGGSNGKMDTPFNK